MTTPTRLTAADFEAFLQRPENADRRLELIDGHIEERMGTYIHGLIIINIGAALLRYVQSTQFGTVSTDARFAPDEANDFRPDVVVMPAGVPLADRGPMRGVPHLAVEVQSPDQTVHFLRSRAVHYLRLGVRVVWLVYPSKKIVEVLTLNSAELFVVGDTLNGGDALPGLALSVADVFAGVE
ncbi:Uma2 family endonuclease [Aggregatilineales bacterium SYSU G02658]